MKIKTDVQAPVAKCVDDNMALSSHPKASMQNLLDAVAEFEPGLVLERVQPIQADVREFESSTATKAP